MEPLGALQLVGVDLAVSLSGRGRRLGSRPGMGNRWAVCGLLRNQIQFDGLSSGQKPTEECGTG